MVLIINASCFRFGGAVQVALSFIYECRKFPQNEYHVFIGSGVKKSLREAEFPDNFHFYYFDFGIISLTKTSIINRTLSKFESAVKPDCVITTSGPSYWHSKAPHLMGFNLGLYIYFDSPYFQTISFYRKARIYIKRAIHFWFFKRDADSYIVQTDDVNLRVRQALKTDKVFTISNTYNSFFSEPLTKKLKLPHKKENELWFLTLTSYYRHKNLEIIPGILKELKHRGYDNVRFLLTLDDRTFVDIFANENTGNIINVGFVKPEDCPALYNACDYMFLPSLAECFSASYPEAMVMKRPIVTTDLPFARSICEDAALYYEPMNSVSAADTIEKLLKNENVGKTLIENGLKRLSHFVSAEERAKRILQICNMIAEKSRV
jgi:glycosyltransferase involved in cell wall biosynthesis